MIADSLPPPAPAADDPRYLVEDTRAIGQLLMELCKRAIPVIMQPSDSDIASPSLVLEVGNDGSLHMDGSSVEAVNIRLTRSSRLYCHAELEKVQVRFVLEDPVAVKNGHQITFKALWPTRVFHHQRRELFRLQTPVADSPMLEFQNGEPLQSFALRIVDIGVGGIGVQHDLPEGLLDQSVILEHCSIVLPETTLHPVHLKVANERTVTFTDGRTARRTGMAFIKLPQSMQNAISRYIFSVERLRNARRQGKN